MAKSLYIHIPFCDQICSYCDFAKIYSKGQDIDKYIAALVLEMEIYRKEIEASGKNFDLKTIYIGGGTPTLLTVAQLEKLFSYLHSIINFDTLEEVSIEANPESLCDPKKICCLKKYGVTRVSLGVQTFNAKHLQTLERNHCNSTVFCTIDLLAQNCFEINVDLIYSIPGQSLAQWEEDLERLFTLPVTHVSTYSLILEKHTKFYRDFLKGRLDLVDNVVEALMFEKGIEKLVSAGFEHYEISNFTLQKKSAHNMTYWKNEPYIAVGLGAHGFLDGTRYENTRSITAYMKNLMAGKKPVLNEQKLTIEDQIEESMFLGLRLMEGICLNDLSNRYNRDIYALYEKNISKLVKQNYLVYTDISGKKMVKLTKDGLMMANNVFEEFLL